jgi:N-acetyl-anhydromuramyl-L-alanine amidase AmpD
VGDCTVDRNWMIPLEGGQSVSKGWGGRGKPVGVTWHWAVATCNGVVDTTIGGKHAERKGVASAHCCIGRTNQDGVHWYVSLENRSWHAGLNQRVNAAGHPLVSADDKGSRATIGIETCTMGIIANPEAGSILTATPLGVPCRVQAWTEEQIAMCITVGREIVARWPHIGPDDHHGHHDLCPLDNAGRAYKTDVVGFPFARVLRGIYPDREIYDHWTPTLTVAQRQKALSAAGYTEVGAADGVWGKKSSAALQRFQQSQGMLVNGCWGTFVSRALAKVLRSRGIDLAQVTA